MVRRMTGPWWTAAVALVVAGCAGLGSNPAGAGSGVAATARSSTSASASVAKTATPADALRPQAKPIWLRSLQMTSATTGWALYYWGDPNSSSPVFLLLARTTDGGRSWTDVTPAAARLTGFKLAANLAHHMDVAATGPRTVTATSTPGRAARPVAPPDRDGLTSPG